MIWASFKRVLRYGYQSFMRDKGSSGATLLIMVVTLASITSLLLLRGAVGFLVDSLEQRVDVSAYFYETTQEQQILDLKTQLLLMPEIKEVTYTSQEEALATFREAHKDDPIIISSLDTVGKNPLLASLNMRTKEFGDYAKAVEFLQGQDYAPLISKIDYQDRAPVIRQIYSLTSGIQLFGILMSIGFAIIVVLVTFNTVRLAIYNASKEIEIMRLVGASSAFIRGPFIIQGVIVGIVASIITTLLFIPIVFLLNGFTEHLLPGFELSGYFFSQFFLILFLQLICGVGLGVLSSLFAIRKYLRI
ncbi:MAG: permease-like cell division protein FtsX [bacterium]|nr:permease-like cell division protein FtsX [bacterium]